MNAVTAIGAAISAATRPAPAVARKSASPGAYLLVPVFLMFILLVIAVLRSPNLISQEGLGSAIIVAGPLILATFAMTPIAIAGRGGVDLSIGPLIGFINVTLIRLVEFEVIESPIAVFAYAIAVGIIYQLLMGLIIVFVRVQPIIVALAGYLAFAGVNLVILQRPGGVAPFWMGDWAMGTSIFNPVLAILIVATVAWIIFARSAFYGHMRFMGSDERAAYASGVRINLVRLGAHVIAGIYAGLAAITFTSLISSGDPTQGTTYTLMAVTALVLGGTSLGGGRGGAIGSLLGALDVYLITYVLATFNFGQFQSFVTDLAYGLILMLSLLLTLLLPYIQHWTRFISPFLFFVLLSVLALGVVVHAKYGALGGIELPPMTVLGGSETASPAAGGGEPAGPVPVAPPLPGQGPDVFAFENLATTPDTAAPPAYAKMIAYLVLIILTAVLVVRAAVAQVKSRELGALVFFVLMLLVLFGLYVVAEQHGGLPGVLR